MSKILKEVMKEVPDYRKGNGIRHKLPDILMIGLLTMICNGNDYAAMRVFGEVHEEKLREHLELPKGIPSQDTFERVFARLDPRRLEKVFRTWLIELHGTFAGRVHASIDGKAMPQTGAFGKAAHVVSAFASELGLLLGQCKTAAKSNEIKAIPELLEMFCQKGMIITIDAMGTQRAVAKKIVELDGDYILAVKRNQCDLLSQIHVNMDAKVFTQGKDELAKKGQYFCTVEESHGRIETRECYFSKDVEDIGCKEKWAGLSGMAIIYSTREVPGKEPSTSRRVFITSLKDSNASEILQLQRSHWAIENNLHWMLDVLFREDDCRARIMNSAENLNSLRKLALQLMKRESSFKASMKSKRLRCAWDFDYALLVIASL